MIAKLLEKTVDTNNRSQAILEEASIVNEKLLTLDQMIQLLQSQGASESFLQFVAQDILKHGDLYEALA